MRHGPLSLTDESAQRWGNQSEVVIGQSDARPFSEPGYFSATFERSSAIRENVNTLAPFVGGRTDVRFANAYALDVSMIGRQDHLEAAFEHCIEKPPKGSPLRPMPDPGMHPISAIDDAVQHLIDRADHDACDSASRLIDLFDYPLDERIVVFKRTLTGIDGIAFANAAIVPEPHPVLLFLARRIEALAEKEWRITREDRLTGY